MTAASSSLRDRRVTTHIGLALGLCVAVCFVTGILSHWIQHPPDWFWWPSRPVWLYRVTQGAHVITGVMAIPLLLAKLVVVYPKLFERPVIGSPARLLERLSIAVLVAATIFQLVTGLFNTAHWYPWTFFFTTTHHAMAYVVVGSIVVHVAVKLPIIRDALDAGRRRGGEQDERGPVHPGAVREEGDADDGATPDHERRLVSRRTVVRSAWAAAGVAAVVTAGQTVTPLRRLAVLAPRSGDGPQGLPVNRTADQAGIVEAATDPAYRLRIVGPGIERVLTHAELAALPQHTVALPIACVEGWSAEATWTGVRLSDLVALVDRSGANGARMVSLERGAYAVSDVPGGHVRDPKTLIALAVNGQRLDLDHGYPCRLIAPNLPGVMQTKWLARIEVS
ncbi:molybdopterin-dependent oxidoreductase [Gordonia soli]|uniref:Oxidoreductase molybdopterin-binding domain-containing protein n=1 Tax=Gordonia soli NBRC 108243 TaxID=1223545 RepID=M0QD74_9ACTN|nr:molybdopterin-dependent oxidoreductase [Gordonia soli]GAC66568.1 hypothetical protein GS4_03_00150 [Gordonia soli NBRC 108243]